MIEIQKLFKDKKIVYAVLGAAVLVLCVITGIAVKNKLDTQHDAQVRLEKERIEKLNANNDSTASEDTTVVAEQSLTESQNIARQSYTDEDKHFIDVIKKLAWVAQDGATLEFSDAGFVIKKGSDIQKEGSFAMRALTGDINALVEPTQAVNAPLAAFEMEDGTIHIVKIGYDFVQNSPQDDSRAVMKISSDIFGTSDFIAGSKSAKLEIKDTESLSSVTTKDAQQLLSALETYVRANYPTAATATWTKTATVDLTRGSVDTTFSLDDVNNTTLKAHWEFQDNSFSFTRG